MNKNIKSYKLFEEVAPRIPRLTKRGLNYWKGKGKKGKDVMIYTHDDMDGIFSAIAVKSRLLDLGYNIIGYGVLNYMDAWKNTKLDPEIINVAVDFAEMPNDKNKDLIDIYIDHHGEYSEDEKEFYKENPVIKTKTGSAYEGICKVIGKQIDEITLYSIDMIDSAKYDDYKVDWRDIINFSWDKFIEIANRPGKVTIKPFKDSKPVTFGWPIIAKLTFAGAFNQFLKRSDHKTIIEVIDNVKEPSIYLIYLTMKKIYPGNNIWKSGDEKDFIKDSSWRIETMKKRTKGYGNKPIYNSQEEFIKSGAYKNKGYQLIGNLMFVPSGTWANALRARSILLSDIDKGIVPENKIKFILLQYGDTLQVVSVNKIEETEELPILKNGKIDNLGKYMESVLNNFKKFFGYSDNSETDIEQDKLTISGGHVGIGTISNIVGKINKDNIVDRKNELSPIEEKLINKYDGYKYIDLIKNKIISDLSGLDKKWPIGLKWLDNDNVNIKNQMIKNIINNHVHYQKLIKNFIEKNDFETKSKLENIIKDKINNKLKTMSDEEIKKLHDQAMLNNKVMMKSDIRQMDVKGNIPNRKEWDKIKSFEQFNK